MLITTPVFSDPKCSGNPSHHHSLSIFSAKHSTSTSVSVTDLISQLASTEIITNPMYHGVCAFLVAC